DGMEEWKECKLKDIVEINPTESLKKGTVAKKIGMDVLQPYCRAIPSFSFEPYTGGTKFKNGDTIMARITPCLENGKTAMVNILDDNEIGFGSTEYIVFRAKNNITDIYFIYYLVTSDCIRNPAIKSMVGSSGRQRVQTDVVANLSIKLPPLPTQQKIAAILSSLDDKIELNNKINTNLEQQAGTLFKNWFVDFEPFGGKMPEGWKVGKLSEIAEITSGKRSPMKQSDYSKDVSIPLVGAASVMGYTNQILYNEPILITGRVGTHGIIQRFRTECWPSDNTLIVKSKNYEYVYQVMCNIDYVNMNRGSTQPLITQSDLGKVECVIPDDETLIKFEKITSILFEKHFANCQENQNLANLRDTLLPKLMSGEIEVNNIEEFE
ncbi:restriction endonuclease subunit S, partial [Methanobrevibacter ruminantium]|uniref:restriction endonuclease subunit S n=1 Tax=Methanobrevibacter ruminantium TaxID=83816 RepID=UPI0026ED7FC8